MTQTGKFDTKELREIAPRIGQFIRDDWGDVVAKAADHIDAQAAEIERLREALSGLLGIMEAHEMIGGGESIYGDIARAALAQQKTIQRPKLNVCATCKGVGVIGHSENCPECCATWVSTPVRVVMERDDPVDVCLRDTFAMRSLPVVATGHFHVGENFFREAEYDAVAKDAYLIADAMLRARSQGDSE